MKLVRTMKIASWTLTCAAISLAAATARADDEPQRPDDDAPAADAATKVATPPDAPATTLVAAAERTCRGDALGGVLRKIERGSVSVRTHVAMGSGFAVAGGWIVTDFDLVRRPQGLRVIRRDGAIVEASVVAVDDVRRIAILRPEYPLDVAPLELADSGAKLGTDVVIVGAPDLGATPPPPPAVLRAIVTREGEQLAIDASTWAQRGAAIVDCDGLVVGLATAGGAVPVDAVIAAQKRVGREDEYAGPVVDFGSLETGVVVQFDEDDAFVGGQLGLGMLFADRVEVSARVGVLGGTEESTKLREVDALRISSDARVGYRANIATMPLPVWLVPSVGAAVMYDWRRVTEHELSITDTGCVARGRCQVESEERAVETEKVTPMAVIGLDLRIDVLDIGYSLFVSPTDGNVIHQVGLGVATY